MIKSSIETMMSFEDRDPHLASIVGQDRYHTWRCIVKHYSQRSLTFAADRLPALAGIASYFQEHLPNDEYRYGLWTGNLPHDLLWSVVFQQHASIAKFPSRRPYKATPQGQSIPSWSWASEDSDYIIQWSSLPNHDLKGPSEMHQCTPGCGKRLHKPCAQVPWTTMPSFPTALVIKGNPIKVQIDPDSYPERESFYQVASPRNAAVFPSASPNRWFWTRLDPSYVQYVGSTEGPECPIYAKTSYWTILPIWQANSYLYNVDTTVQGLILVKAQDKGPGFYYRVGLAFMSWPEDEDTPVPEGIEFESLDQQDLCSDDYIERDERGEYVIALV
ncbi:hypothetical protein NX059_001280 [Plenodomus lindquistii]|nr:hypothetical protein NX059_001280 [Plenodomus lindquistii]